MAVYELTVLEHLDKGSVQSKDSTAIEARWKVEEFIRTLDVNILKHEYDGVKKLAYEIQGSCFAGYDYYELEVTDSKASMFARIVSLVLDRLKQEDGSGTVLRYLCTKRMSEEELKARKAQLARQARLNSLVAKLQDTLNETDRDGEDNIATCVKAIEDTAKKLQEEE